METCLEFEEGSGARVEWERADVEVGRGGKGEKGREMESWGDHYQPSHLEPVEEKPIQTQ